MRSLTEYNRTDISRLAPRVAPDANKRDRGGVLVVGGSTYYRGAPLLAARAALRAGCGLAFLAVPDFLATAATAYLPEAIVLPIPANADGFYAYDLTETIAPFADKMDAAVVGPGIGRLDRAEAIVQYFLGAWQKPLLLDADALYHLTSPSVMIGKKARGRLVITPHAGEAARLLGLSADEVNAHRQDSVTILAEKYGTALLKGPHTLVADRLETRVILEGGPELSVPGSGDVLSGAIGAYLARGLSRLDAATLGALVHALAGKRAGRVDGLLAGEIADGIWAEGSEE